MKKKHVYYIQHTHRASVSDKLNPGGFLLLQRPFMKYDKGPLSFEEQAERLISRGLIADKTLLVSRLKNVNYYKNFPVEHGLS
ncbi:MAG TPA: hypothetical protein DCL44_11635 [Elusimicrobia bacterium]|nr:hypothetical protein [Elusimicrobiota bacterium]